MSSFQSDHLSSWRRACLLVESVKEVQPSSPTGRLTLVAIHTLSIRCAALLAESRSAERTEFSLNCLVEAEATLQALMSKLIQIDLIGLLSDDEAALLQSETAYLSSSVTTLIRSLRSPE